MRDLNNFINKGLQEIKNGFQSRQKCIVEQRLLVDGAFHYLYPKIHAFFEEKILIDNELFYSDQIVPILNHILEMETTSYAEFHKELMKNCDDAEDHFKHNFFYHYHSNCILMYFEEYLPRFHEICQLTSGLLILQLHHQTFLVDKFRPYIYQIPSPYKFQTFKIIFVDQYGRIMLENSDSGSIFEEFIFHDPSGNTASINDIIKICH